MADDVTRDLVVALQSISYSGSSSATLLSNPIDVFIDSTDPNIWLPADACDAFERTFGLTLDEETGLYLVNETHRNTLLDSNAEVSFRLSDVRSGGDTVTIVLPFAAFDLTAEQPLVGNTSHYFPLKRANSSMQYTLGRTFLQEAYVNPLPRYVNRRGHYSQARVTVTSLSTTSAKYSMYRHACGTRERRRILSRSHLLTPILPAQATGRLHRTAQA